MKIELMSWEQCQREHIRKVEVDVERINSILKMCSVRLRVATDIKLDNETASIIAEDFYEIIKELLTAVLLFAGFKSDNHECLIAFFKKSYPEKEYEACIIYELKRIRNKINYEGFFIEKNYIEKNKLEFLHIIQFLTEIITEKLKNDKKKY